MEAATILAALADLAPASAERIFDVSGTGRPLVWLPEPDRGPRGIRLDRLAALDALHRDERILRRGLAFVVAGPTWTVDDAGCGCRCWPSRYASSAPGVATGSPRPGTWNSPR
ncbi:hypothetical protein [Micromonospora sp. RTP1Z1]|uniref:hypothetical protein n=1 Tax=Micromonospora sp. RTP1Z1 TaxID=2994043 RepID=UPI0029C7D8AD|nr:hypothetical protein [Micromonospora sp. RTP1Z1]